MGSVLLKVPELAISKEEAKLLNDAATDVMRFYTDVDIPPVVQAWLNFAMVAGTVYGPRVVAVQIRKRSQTVRNVTQQSQAAPTPINRPQAVPPAPKQEPQKQREAGAALREWSQWNQQQAVINNFE